MPSSAKGKRKRPDKRERENQESIRAHLVKPDVSLHLPSKPSIPRLNQYLSSSLVDALDSNSPLDRCRHHDPTLTPDP